MQRELVASSSSAGWCCTICGGNSCSGCGSSCSDGPNSKVGVDDSASESASMYELASEGWRSSSRGLGDKAEKIPSGIEPAKSSDTAPTFGGSETCGWAQSSLSDITGGSRTGDMVLPEAASVCKASCGSEAGDCADFNSSDFTEAVCGGKEPTYLPTYLRTHLPTYRPTDLPTYLPACPHRPTCPVGRLPRRPTCPIGQPASSAVDVMESGMKENGIRYFSNGYSSAHAVYSSANRGKDNSTHGPRGPPKSNCDWTHHKN